MDEKDNAIIAEFKQRLMEDIKKYVTKIIVFGSRARGTAADDSDLDVIALVISKNPEIEKKLEDAAYAVMWDHDFMPIISLKVFTESQFNDAMARGFSFYKHIEQEGVTV